MAYEVEYFHPRIQATIESWPVDVLADYARLVELLIEHGPGLRLPHSLVRVRAKGFRKRTMRSNWSIRWLTSC